jgi:hypothetical protein
VLLQSLSRSGSGSDGALPGLISVLVPRRLHTSGRRGSVGRWPFPRLVSQAGPVAGQLPPPALTKRRCLPLEDHPDRLLLATWRPPKWAPLTSSSPGVFSKTAPPPTSPCASSLGCPRFGFATPERVPLLSFFPTSAAFSAHGFAGLLHPAAGHGVRLVSSRPPTAADVRPSSEACCPSKLSTRTAGSLSPGSWPPRRWSR